jgi:hypothetical protein
MQQRQQQQQQQKRAPSGVATSAPWGSTAAVPPDAGYYSFVGFPAADDAPRALPAAAFQVPGGGLRPGNNTPLRPQQSQSSRVPWLHAACVPDAVASATAPPTIEEQAGFREFYYWGNGAAPPRKQAPFYGRA